MALAAASDENLGRVRDGSDKENRSNIDLGPVRFGVGRMGQGGVAVVEEEYVQAR